MEKETAGVGGIGKLSLRAEHRLGEVKEVRMEVWSLTCPGPRVWLRATLNLPVAQESLRQASLSDVGRDKYGVLAG